MELCHTPQQSPLAPAARTGLSTRLLGAFGGVVLAVALVGCSDDGDPTQSADPNALVAQVASYDHVAGPAQRILVGLFNQDQELLGGGEVHLRFAYLGTTEDPQEDVAGPGGPATFRPIPGQQEAPPERGSIGVTAGGARGVYGIDGITFDRPGWWEVTATAEVSEGTRTGTSTFEVLADSSIPAVGDVAPRTANHLPGAPGVPPKAVDSRAEDDGSVPDPALHETTVADAMAAGRPTMVVVSTPVYCVSQFCGPITETVDELARANGDAMAFVHLEVWRNYDENNLNQAAAEWIFPTRTEEAREPWVFVVGRDGRIIQRFDNVATEDELAQAVDAALES